jgi:predicted nucleic acid-binding protein
VSIVVLDNSAAIELLGDDGVDSAALRKSTIYAPELIDIEFTHAVRKLTMLRRIGVTDATQIVSRWSTNRVIRCDHARFLPRIWQLRDNFTSYDAAYVALAEHLGLPLVTADRRLAKSAERYCEVVIVGNSST